MRAFVLVFVLAACGDKVPSPPDPAEYARMGFKQKCSATAPRATMCQDELLVAQLRSLDGGSEMGDEVAKSLGDRPASSEDDKWKIHKTMCIGERGTGFPDAVMRCWKTEPCKAFAHCVMRQPGK